MIRNIIQRLERLEARKRNRLAEKSLRLFPEWLEAELLGNWTKWRQP